MEQQPSPLSPKLDSMTPRQIVEELDRYVIGQKDAKRMVAIAGILIMAMMAFVSYYQ